ncbi:MAG: hypothetical protein GC168_20640 [Candidatus Hydrogenedens sp.]|nr:hypothetical protein [Candidatus Hydrogenedens sp.]
MNATDDFLDDDGPEPVTTRNPDGTVTLTLAYPVTVTLRAKGEEREEVIAALDFRRATGADLKAIGEQARDNPIAAANGLIARLTGQPVVVVDRMDGIDIEAASAIVQGFTARRRPTGRR